MKPRRAIYPGSFDPLTLGHHDIIARLQPLFDEIIVLVAHSPTKAHWFTAGERKAFIEKSLADLPNVRVDIFEGLTVEYAKATQACAIVRGLRAVADFEYEMGMANMNARLSPHIETLICFARPEFNYISSRMVKEVALYGGDVKGLVPSHVEEAIRRKVKEIKK